MPRQISSFGKNNAPWQACRTTVKFSIDEVTYSAEPQPNRDASTDQVRYFPEVPAFLFRDVEGCEDDANKPSMKRHPSLPDLEDVERRLQIATQVIEEDVSDSATYHDTDNDVEQQIVEIIRCEFQSPLFRQALQQEVADDE